MSTIVSVIGGGFAMLLAAISVIGFLLAISGTNAPGTKAENVMMGSLIFFLASLLIAIVTRWLA